MNTLPAELSPALTYRRPGFWSRTRQSWQTFAQNRLAVAGVIIILIFAVLAISHPILMATVWRVRGIYDPKVGFDIDLAPHPTAPSRDHVLGTDTLGRDVLSRLLAATTPTFIVGLTAALSTAILSTIIGALSAYYKGKLDASLSLFTDVALLIPPPIVLIAAGSRFHEGVGPFQLGLLYGVVVGAGSAAMVMRTYALSVVSKPFIDAARVSGSSGLHLIRQHLLPHMLPLAALQMMLAMTGAIIADGFGGFSGLTQNPLNWGSMVYEAFAYEFINSTIQWNTLIPASLMLSGFALAFYLISRGLHQMVDPQMRVTKRSRAARMES